MERKAAFQMSMGFIIAVVFAIVLLSLALTWLRGMMDGLMGITDDLTQEAQANLRDAFRETATSFAVWPNQYNLDPGKGLRMSAGIENDAIDGKDHKFVINVVPATADEKIVSIKGCTNFETCTTLKEEMKTWATFDKSVGLIQINSVGFKFVEIRPQADAIKGTYMFNVVACYDKVIGSEPSSSTCTQLSDNLWGGSAKPVLISIT